MKNKKKFEVVALIAAMLACTGSMFYGVYSATNQTVKDNGSITVTSYPHVDATVDCVITPYVGTTAQTVLNCTQLVIDETKAKQNWSISDFTANFESALHGNVASSSDDGRIDVVDSAKVAFTITNTSADYLLDYSIAETDSSLINMNATTVDSATASDLAVSTGSATSTYTISITDKNLSASGTFDWSVVLTAKNQ